MPNHKTELNKGRTLEARALEEEQDTPPPIHAEMHETVPAGFWRRFVAYIVDGIGLGIITAPINVVAGLVLSVNLQEMQAQLAQGHTPPEFGQYFTFVAAGSIVLSALYYWLFYKFCAATPGKLILGCKVYKKGTTESLGFGRTIVREVLCKTFLAPLFLLGCIIAGIRKDKRGFHDFVGGTQVVRK